MYWSLENVPWTNLHDLNLDWIVNTMKQTVEQWIAYRIEMNQKYADFTEQINSDFDDFTTQINTWKTLIEGEFSDLQTYVQNYFDNLDLNESTRYVINQMIASGEFVEVLEPSIVSSVEQWLTEHITPTTPVIDDTLTISGAAADAKVTGDKINSLDQYILKYANENKEIIPAWIDGNYVNYTNGNFSVLTGRSRTDKIELQNKNFVLYINGLNDNTGLAYYTSTGIYISGVQFAQGLNRYILTAPENAKYVAFSTITDNKNNVILCYLNKNSIKLSKLIANNIYIPSITWKANSYINYLTGDFSILNGNSATYKIPVKFYNKILIGVWSAGDNRGCAFYDSTGALISSVQFQNNYNYYDLDVPENTTYFATSCPDDYKNDFVICLYSNADKIKNILADYVKNDNVNIDITWNDNGYWHTDDGHIAILKWSSYSNLLKTNDAKQLYIEIETGVEDYRGVVFKDKHGAFISACHYQLYNTKYLFNIPTNAYFVGITNPNKNENILVRFIGIPSSNATKEINGDCNHSLITMFNNIGFVGDSYTKSQLYTQEGVSMGYFEKIGYPAVMARFYSFTQIVFAWGGATTESWLSQAWGLQAALSADPQQLYILALGINDKSYVTKGTINDIKPDWHDNPNTFYGNYGKIIEQLKAHAPNAKFLIVKSFLPTDPNGQPSGFYTYSDIPCEEIANHYNFPFVETMDSDYLSSDQWVNKKWGAHPTAPLYAGLALELGKLIDKTILDNVEYFSDFKYN